MLGSKLALFSRALRSVPKFTASANKRALYTDSIYPYPFNYINNTLYPSQFFYRENYPTPPWAKTDQTIAKWAMRGFWFYFFINLFNDPGVIIGHHVFPDPTKWTDEELGIPPEDVGSYKDWLASRKANE